MNAKALLIAGGIALAVIGMAYGLWYAVFAEHQALDSIGASLVKTFTAAAQRDSVGSQQGVAHYREAKCAYDRQVDVHSHWLGLAMLLIIIGLAADGMGYSEGRKTLIAWTLLLGSFLFPLGVLIQTFSHGPWPRAIAIAASGMVIVALCLASLGFLRPRPA
ncbi:MAG TPA: hypothetical protein VE783_08115 [Candidatus Limnocylindrales bacterium]|nr:hypothetical protein [Candidatus Limnocylindrales bacterium]